ncbi:hypothetical protein OCC_07299 [Thermococcus litoralis DSM 5473]|uniref:DUF86 domain-containing protein n=1 Tax=Thermococcus litoralis (strain ATCC 51850 / DSM 5473 / JCM 8560 / NS-C) TaxID=523849 RepID=H3ZMD7_THELN|nr:DUF86 domain-containing protein [Thermococcus litoralis]EHR78922.1 hypothetical protein OCC_07299 [Thermococcus litoralis DSM 5473]
MRRRRYLEKLERLEEEYEFIKSHEMKDEVTKRALLYSLQICVEIAMDIVAMLTRDMGIVVEDDYTNIERLRKEEVLTDEEAQLLKKYNGLRNAIVHRYDHLNLEIVKEGLKRIDELYEIVIKLVNTYEKIEES